MRNLMVVALLMATCWPALAAENGPAPAEAALTLPQVLAQTLTTSPRLEQARSAVANARGQKRGARAEAMPSLGASTGELFQRTNERAGARSRQFEGNVDASVPLYTGGRVKAGKRAAGQAEQAALARLEAEAQRLVLDVTEAYLDALQARQETLLLGELRKLNQERLRVAQVRLAAGVGFPLDVSQTEADLAAAVQREIEAQARQRQLHATLNTLMGRPAAAPLTLATDLSPSPSPTRGGEQAEPASRAQPAEVSPPSPFRGEAGGEVPGLPTLEAATPEQARALGLRRPDLRALRADAARAEAGVDSARAARRPLGSLSGNLVQRIPETFLGGFAWSLGSSLVQSLFDGGRSPAVVEQARAERARAGASLAEAERRADEQVEQARVALEAAEKRLAAEDRRVAAAREGLAVAEKRFRAETAARIEVTEAETVLTRAQTDALVARFEVSRSRVRLAYAAGIAYPETVNTQMGSSS
jgi:outer membrane protein